MKIHSAKIAVLAAAALALSLAEAAADEITMRLPIGGTNYNGVQIGNYFFDPVGTLSGVELGDYATEATRTVNGQTYYWTFCLEYNEYFTNGGNYNVSYNDGATSGGVSGATDGEDVICAGTAALYKLFATGSSLFDYSNASSAATVQLVIWYLEGEIRSISNGAQALYNTLLDTVFGGSIDAMLADYTGSEVQVMNLTTASGGRSQDQLILTRVPDGGTTIALLGVALLGLVAIRRRTV